MAFFTEALNLVQLVVTGLGAAYAVIGIINFSQGHSQHNAAKKEDGMGQLLGGGAIAMVGMLLVPQLAQFFGA